MSPMRNPPHADRPRRRSKAKREGWLIGELAALVGATPRALRHYVECGVLPAPVFRGKATRYQRVHLLRLVALLHWRATEELPLSQARERLDAVASNQLEGYVWSLPLRDELLTLLHQRDPWGRSAPPADLANRKPLPAPHVPPPTPRVETSPAGSSLWRRLPLLPGLELHLDTNASPVARDLAREVQELLARKLSR